MLRNYIAYFVVEIADDGKWREEAGFYPAASFAEAMTCIEEFFGDELCTVTHLELLDSSLMLMRADDAKKIVEYNYG